jgi:glyoxylase I family protein
MPSSASSDLAFDHVAIPIADPEATLTFYSDVLGLTLVEAFDGADWGGLAWLMLIFAAADGRQLAFIAFDGGKPTTDNLPADARHYAFSAADLSAWRSRLSKAGVEFHEEDHGSQQSIYFRDPNGLTLEITSPASAGAASGNPDAAAAVAAWTRRHGR